MCLCPPCPSRPRPPLWPPYVRAELEADEVLDVVEDGLALPDGGHDGDKVVVHQDHVGRLLADVRAGPAHGDADVGRLQRHGVVDPIARHAHHHAVGLQRLQR